jgi:hypothetical protein
MMMVHVIDVASTVYILVVGCRYVVRVVDYSKTVVRQSKTDNLLC